MALEFDADWEDFNSVKVGMNPSEGSGLVEILSDPDKNGVFKVTDKDTQKFKIVGTDSAGHEVVAEYDLSGLTLTDE